MNIVFRTDAAAAIGSGHVMRCLTLAKRYRREGHTVSFVMRELPSNSIAFVVNEGFAVDVLPYAPPAEAMTGYLAWLTVTQEQDAAETGEVLRAMGVIDRLVVDHYALDMVWESRCRPLARELMVIGGTMRIFCSTRTSMRMQRSAMRGSCRPPAACSLALRTRSCAMSSMR